MESTSCPVDLITTFRKQSHLIWTERTKYNDTSLRDACKQKSRDTESIGRESTAIRDFGALITHTLKTMNIKKRALGTVCSSEECQGHIHE
jgi:hypothetical protein